MRLLFKQREMRGQQNEEEGQACCHTRHHHHQYHHQGDIEVLFAERWHTLLQPPTELSSKHQNNLFSNNSVFSHYWNLNLFQFLFFFFLRNPTTCGGWSGGGVGVVVVVVSTRTV